jgi:hypothetical protein
MLYIKITHALLSQYSGLGPQIGDSEYSSDLRLPNQGSSQLTIISLHVQAPLSIFSSSSLAASAPLSAAATAAPPVLLPCPGEQSPCHANAVTLSIFSHGSFRSVSPQKAIFSPQKPPIEDQGRVLVRDFFVPPAAIPVRQDADTHPLVLSTSPSAYDGPAVNPINADASSQLTGPWSPPYPGSPSNAENATTSDEPNEPVREKPIYGRMPSSSVASSSSSSLALRHVSFSHFCLGLRAIATERYSPDVGKFMY